MKQKEAMARLSFFLSFCEQRDKERTIECAPANGGTARLIKSVSKRGNPTDETSRIDLTLQMHLSEILEIIVSLNTSQTGQKAHLERVLVVSQIRRIRGIAHYTQRVHLHKP